MPLDADALLNWPVQEIELKYTERDVMLYALGLGLGGDPTDENELAYVYEKQLKVLPTYPVVLTSQPAWIRDPRARIDRTKVVHGEVGIDFHAELPSSGTVISRSKVVAVTDKGEGGALIYADRQIVDAVTLKPYATIRNTTFARADGGFGGSAVAYREPPGTPSRAPDLSFVVATLPQQALIYRLSGDYNPLHAEPAFAHRAGFDRPILHGLVAYGIAVRVILERVCNWDAARLKSADVRFSSPVFPGESLRIDLWVDGTDVGFAASVPARGKTVLKNGHAKLAL